MSYPVWIEGSWRDVPVPEMGGESIVVPNVAAVVRDESGERLLLQRRDKPGEPVRGLLEIPGGRWGAGEPPDRAVAREVAEETGIELIEIVGRIERVDAAPNRACMIARPVAVINGIEGAYPSLHVLFESTGRGDPRPQEGETADPRWWPVAEVKALLQRHPERFVDQTRAMLVAYFGAKS